MSAITTDDVVIKGVTSAGRTFRPSDWAERLSGVLSTYGDDHRMSYSPYVRPRTLDGVKCVIVNKRLQEADPRAYDFVMKFAQSNDLQVVDGGEFGAR